MSDGSPSAMPGIPSELLALSLEEVLAAMEREEEEIIEALSVCIQHYAGAAGEELKSGRDHLPILLADESTPAIHAVAMGIVLETFEEELDALDE